MKVYELMGELSKLPSGAEVSGSAMLTTSELESGCRMGNDDDGETLYSVCRNLECVDHDGHRVFLSF